jgi:outer membrane protein assembly factor BamD
MTPSHGKKLVSALGAALLLALAGCGTTDSATKLTRELLATPKEDAYARGEALVAKKKYDQGRQYLRFVAENYANDPIGKQAALRLADSYFDEKTSVGYLEAQARYKDFRNRYPSHPKADYAVFRLAQCADRQAEKPDRDQANTRIAASSYRELLQLYPDSPYATESRTRLKVVQDLLAEHEWRVAHFYLKRRAYRAAKDRLDTLMAAFPEYSHFDRALFDSGLVESRLGHKDDARDRFVRLTKDYPSSPLVKRVPNSFVVTARATAGGGS